MAEEVDPEKAWLNLIWEKSYDESAAFDALVAKLGTAGITLAVAVAALTDADNWVSLVASGFSFAIALSASLIGLKLGSEGLRSLGSGDKERSDVWQYEFTVTVGTVTTADGTEKPRKWKVEPVRTLNWISAIALPAAYVFLALHILSATILTTGR